MGDYRDLTTREAALLSDVEHLIEELRFEARVEVYSLRARIVALESHASRLQAELEEIQGVRDEAAISPR